MQVTGRRTCPGVTRRRYAAAMEIGQFGVWTTYRAIGEDNAGAAARLAEDLGYSVFWLGGSPRLARVRPLLEASETLVVATSIVNIWAYEPAQLASRVRTARARLRRAPPGWYRRRPSRGDERLLQAAHCDEGVSRRPRRSRPAAPAGAPRPRGARAEDARPERRALARRPALLRAARPYGGRRARQLGSGPLLAPEVAVVVDDDAERARAWRASSRRCTSGSATTRATCSRCGFSEEDVAGGGSDRLIDAVVPHGTPDELARIAAAHLAAGADHVALQVVGEPGIPRQGWTSLAAALVRRRRLTLASGGEVAAGFRLPSSRPAPGTGTLGRWSCGCAAWRSPLLRPPAMGSRSWSRRPRRVLSRAPSGPRAGLLCASPPDRSGGSARRSESPAGRFRPPRSRSLRSDSCSRRLRRRP